MGRHKWIYGFFRPLVAVFLRLKFGYRYEPAKDLPEPYIVLANHTTDYDPLMVGASFRRPMYFVASEHISRWGFTYKLLRFAFAPILRRKGTLAASTVLEILRKIRAGSNVCIFAEGGRSWDGVTGPILPSTGELIKGARCALVTYKITGGYFVSPRWSEANTRRGEVYGAPVAVYTSEQLKTMSPAEINEIIRRDLHEDACERQLMSPKKYRGKNPAEHMENFLFLCTKCRAMDSMRSRGDTVSCTACGYAFRYDVYGMLQESDFRTVRELFLWQKDEVRKDAVSGAVYTADSAVLRVIGKETDAVVEEGKASLSAEALTCGKTAIPFPDISDMDIHGRRGIVFTAQKNYYELIPAPGFNALKFQLLYRELKKIHQENKE